MPSPKTPPAWVAALDEKFTAHEHRSQLAMNELKSELVEVVHAQEKAAVERHNQTLGVLGAHASRLELHELRLGKVEERAKELADDRKAATSDVKRWLLGVAGSVLLALLGALLSLTLRGR